MDSGTNNNVFPKQLNTKKIESDNFNLRVKISKKKKIESSRLEQYNIKRYIDPDKFQFSPDLEELIPEGTPDYEDNGKRYIERITRALGYFKQCALIGPSGTGKTHIVYLVSELTRLPLWEINCGLQTSAYDLFGRYIGLGKENWIDGIITSWCRYGGILYLDEANMMKQDVATRLNPILDARGHMVLTEKDNESIQRHKDAYVIISMNPFSVEFAGTKPLNAAFRRRMSVWLNFDYLSIGDKIDKKEVDLLIDRTEVSREISEKIVKTAAKLRYDYKTGDLPYGPSVGDLANWAKLIVDGSSPQDAGDETIVAMTSDDHEIQDEVRKIINSIDWEIQKDSDTDQKTQVVKAVEKALMSIGKPDLLKVKERLLEDYKRTFADCYEEPEFLNRILKDLYGNSYNTIVDSIKKNLDDISKTPPISKFLEVIAR